MPAVLRSKFTLPYEAMKERQQYWPAVTSQADMGNLNQPQENDRLLQTHRRYAH